MARCSTPKSGCYPGNVKPHVKEEQDEIFPNGQATKPDMVELGARMSARKDELMASLG